MLIDISGVQRLSTPSDDAAYLSLSSGMGEVTLAIPFEQLDVMIGALVQLRSQLKAKRARDETASMQTTVGTKIMTIAGTDLRVDFVTASGPTLRFHLHRNLALDFASALSAWCTSTSPAAPGSH